ncbi:MAG: hypothetical protein AVO39_04305 [delta proteobacterium MLS_D]|jgi:type IV pilus assembly protein PilO|nr:MAG: hypothetical protein AVO39_04305 [delta proteobacterium MLS_D]
MAITADDIKKLPTKYKILIGVGVVLLLGYFYYMFFLQAALSKKQSLTDNLATLETQIAQRRVVARQIEQHRREIKELNENLNIALAKLPEKKDIPNLLSSLASAAMNGKLDILLFEPLPQASREFYAELPVRISVSGGFRDIAAFFEDVAEFPRIVNVAEAIIRGPAEKDAVPPIILKAECLMKTYMFLDVSNEKANESP